MLLIDARVHALPSLRLFGSFIIFLHPEILVRGGFLGKRGTLELFGSIRLVTW